MSIEVKERKETTAEDIRRQFTEYLTLALQGNQARYTRRKMRIRANESIYEDIEDATEEDQEDDELPMNDPYSILIAREPRNWTEFLAMVDDRTLRFYLGKLSEKEGAILFRYLVMRIPFKEMDMLDASALSSETRFATIIRKVRRWISGGK